MALDYRDAMTEPLFFTRLLEFEFLQSIELQVWLHAADRKKGYPRHVADQMIADWQADVAAGLNRVVPFDMDAVLGLASTYSRQKTAKGGFSWKLFRPAARARVPVKEGGFGPPTDDHSCE